MASEKAQEVARRFIEHDYASVHSFSTLALAELVEEAIATERERCAKIAETKYAPSEHGRWDSGYVNAGIGIADAIRKSS